MQIIFRVDASVEKGSGHIMRCINLAEQLSKKGAHIRFICRDNPGGLLDFVISRGFTCNRLSESIHCYELDAFETQSVLRKNYESKADWLIIDHYDFDENWESLMRPFVKKIMVIDDLANRRHNCDLLLDQNYYKNLHSRYYGLVKKSTKLCLGPEYALIASNFFSVRDNLRKRDGIVRRILIFFGAGDVYNQTEYALRAIEFLNRSNLVVDVVVGKSNPHRDQILQYCSLRPWIFYHCQVSYMADLMASADLFIGAGGATTWERCFLGLPSITAILADNQSQVSKDVAAIGATLCIGWAIDKSIEKYINAISLIIDEKDKLLDMEKSARTIANVRQGAVVEEMLRLLHVDHA